MVISAKRNQVIQFIGAAIADMLDMMHFKNSRLAALSATVAISQFRLSPRQLPCVSQMMFTHNASVSRLGSRSAVLFASWLYWYQSVIFPTLSLDRGSPDTLSNG